MWIAELSTRERAALTATFAGWMLDGMDVMVYSFVLPTLIAVWHMTPGQAGALGTSALLVSSVGGWLAGIAADRFGRVKLLQLTIFWFAVFTFLSGFTNSFPQLLVVRGLQGLGFGGEWAVGSVLIGETIRARDRGKAVGTVQGGWAIGWGIAAIAYTLLFSVLPAQAAWRVMFWIGILPALLVLYIQGRVTEPPIFAGKKAERAKILSIFGPDLLRTAALASLVALGAQGGYYAITTWLPLYLKNARGLSVVDTGSYLLVIIVGSFCGYIVGAALTDRIGRRYTLILFAACSAVTAWSYTLLNTSNAAILLLGFPLGFFASGVFSPMGSFFTELFPTRVRASGQGFCYNFGRAAGALFPTFVGVLSAHLSLAHAIGIFAVSAYILMIGAVVLLPETRGVELA